MLKKIANIIIMTTLLIGPALLLRHCPSTEWSEDMQVATEQTIEVEEKYSSVEIRP